MGNLYNTVLTTYSQQLDDLPFGYRFHFASRLYLWQQLPQAEVWLKRLRLGFTASDNPTKALEQLKQSETAKPIHHTNPQLHLFEHLLFRALFMSTIYELDGRSALLKVAPDSQLADLRDQLLADPAALAESSSTSVNFLFLYDRFVSRDEQSLAIRPLAESVLNHLDLSEVKQLRRWCYFLTHAIIGESLFYARAINAPKQAIYRDLLSELEPVLLKYQKQLTLDCLYEFLVCCQLINYKSNISLSNPPLADGFIVEPLRSGRQTLHVSEHRNVLFLMSQSSFHPVN